MSKNYHEITRIIHIISYHCWSIKKKKKIDQQVSEQTLSNLLIFSFFSLIDFMLFHFTHPWTDEGKRVSQEWKFNEHRGATRILLYHVYLITVSAHWIIHKFRFPFLTSREFETLSVCRRYLEEKKQNHWAEMGLKKGWMLFEVAEVI